jgi:hypothetical protein
MNGPPGWPDDLAAVLHSAGPHHGQAEQRADVHPPPGAMADAQAAFLDAASTARHGMTGGPRGR